MPAGLEVGEARVARGGLADDDRVGDAALDDALQVLEWILVGSAEQHDQVEGVPAQRAPRALEHGEEPRVGAWREAAGRNYCGDDSGAAAAEAAAGLVWHVAGARRRRLDPRPGLRVHVGAIVQGP